MEKNYNEVTVEKTWSLMAFAQKFGMPKLAEFTNKETGEKFNSLAFDKNGDITFCHFGYSTQGMSVAEIIANKNELKVGLNSNGKYTLYKQKNAWETINLFD
jgi:hypothetical protein